MLNGDDRGMARHQTLHGAVEAAAAQWPDRVAVADATSMLTYQDLMDRSAALAARLDEIGVREGLVGVCVDRTVNVVIATLAVLRAGAAYVPIDPTSPRQRLALILEDARPLAMVVDGKGSGLVPPGVQRVHVDEGLVPASAPRVETPEDGLAYVIFTSGSTGRPKGVMVEHRHVLALLDSADRHFSFDQHDVWTMFHSNAFDFSVWEMFGALGHGATVVVVPRAAIYDPEAMWRLIEREGVTVLSQTPSYFSRLLGAERRNPEDLRYVVFGGEALHFGSLAAWFEEYGDATTLVNMYGITETTVHVTYREVRPEDVTRQGFLIGRPLSHLSIELVDEHLRPVQDGAVGELLVAGDSVARGYLGRDDLTAERFLPDPARPGATRYRTGDLARLTDTGELEYVGRSDDQVQLNGYRVELREVQHHLQQHPAIGEAVVVARPGPDGGLRLVGYVRSHEAADRLEPLVEAFLRDRLPSYMVPHRVVVVAEIPLNTNGKPDLEALPDPWGQDEVHSPTAPGDAAVEEMVELWREVLGTQTIGEDDTFFHAGGDSIRAMSVASLAQSRGLPVEVEDLLVNPTPARLARLLSARRGRSGPPGGDLVEPFFLVSADDRARLPPGTQDAYPMTALQVGMVLTGAGTHGQGADYHSVSEAVVNEPLDLARLRAAIDQVVDRHAVLRTAFDLTGYSEPLQIVAAEVTAPLGYDDFEGLPPSAQRPAIEALIARERAQPFPGASPPLVRFRAVRLGPDSFVLLWTEHHAILDGWSSALLLEYVLSAYLGRDVDEAPVVAFAEYVAAEVRARGSAGHRDFWRSELHGLPPATRPSPRGPVREREVALPPGLWGRICSAATSAGLMPRSLVEAAVSVAVGMVLEEDDVVIGVVTHGRPDRSGSEQSLGLFLNLVPHRMRIGGTWHDLARQGETTSGRVLPHRRYPLAAIQRDNRFRLSVALNFTDFHGIRSLVEGGVIAQEGARNYTTTDLPLMIEVDRRTGDGELDLVLQARGPEWDQTRERRLAELLPQCLELCVEDFEGSVFGGALSAVRTHPGGR